MGLGPVAAGGGAELRSPPSRHGPIAAAQGWRGDAAEAGKLVVVRGAGAVGEAAAESGCLQREVAVLEGWERPGAAANLCVVEQETQPQRGLRPERQRPHLAPAGGAELWRLQSIPSGLGKPPPKESESRAGSPSHPRRTGPGSGSSGLAGKCSDCGLMVIPRSKTLTPQTSRQVHHHTPAPRPCPPHRVQQGPYWAPRFPSGSRAPRALPSLGAQGRLGHSRRRNPWDPPSDPAALQGGILSGGSYCSPLGPPWDQNCPFSKSGTP